MPKAVFNRPTAAALAGLALIAGCALPEGADLAASPEAAAAPPPRLIETERFDAALAAAGPDAERAEAEAAALAARAAALRARAARLGAGVIDAEARSRLEAARPDPVAD